MTNDFHAHLDECAQCREHPFALCSVGAESLQAEVDATQASNPLVFGERVFASSFAGHVDTPGPTFEDLRAIMDAAKALPPIAKSLRVRSVDDLSFLPKATAPDMGIPPGLLYPQGIPIHADPDVPYGAVKVVYSNGTTEIVRFASQDGAR